MGAAVVSSLVVVAAAVNDQALAPVLLALITLTPLAMVETVGALPGAATAVVRGRRAARRVMPLLHAAPHTGAAPSVSRLPPTRRQGWACALMTSPAAGPAARRPSAG